MRAGTQHFVPIRVPSPVVRHFHMNRLTDVEHNGLPWARMQCSFGDQLFEDCGETF